VLYFGGRAVATTATTTTKLLPSSARYLHKFFLRNKPLQTLRRTRSRSEYSALFSALIERRVRSTMSIKVTADSELARALQDVVSPKLAEVGWSSGMQDDTLTEYIILMLANGKSQDQIASELSNDLLALDPGDPSAVDFARWLFEQVDILNAQINGTAPSTAGLDASNPDGSGAVDGADEMMSDADGPKMYEYLRSELLSRTNAWNSPTGPKAMNSKNGRGVITQINKQLDRGRDNSLHRVRGSNRINSHSSREPPRGPRNQSIQRNLTNAMNGRGQMPMNNMMGQPLAAMQAQASALSPQQTMQLFSMFEQQAAMMAQLASSGQIGGSGQTFNQGAGRGRGRSLFDRVDGKGGRGRGRNQSTQNGQPNEGAEDTAMGDDGASNAGANQDPIHTVCKFNARCTKPDCPFAHQSPAAPPGTPIDTNSECTFGVACKNRKCGSRHPSPAQKFQHQKDQDCLYGPACQNPHCTFKHSEMPACRNGADCATPGCKFFHSKIPCKFTPCTNQRCPYKHEEGQKSGSSANVWTKNVSDRKFVTDEGAPEELIIPGETSVESQEAKMETEAVGDVIG
jgi:hypothetical protein